MIEIVGELQIAQSFKKLERLIDILPIIETLELLKNLEQFKSQGKAQHMYIMKYPLDSLRYALLTQNE